MNITRPTLILNKKTCLRNIEIMAEKAKRHNLRFRPHFKTHQSIKIGNWFRNFGVSCITVSSVRMAKYFMQDNWKDITIAVPINIHEIEELNLLAPNASINILVDSRHTAKFIAEQIKEKIGVYIEISTGYNRSGVLNYKQSKIDDIINILSTSENTVFKGFLAHSGHTYKALSKNEVQNIHFDAVLKLQKLKNHYKPKFPEIEVSLGDTPSCSLSEHFTGIDEIRPGNFVFYDLTQNSLGACHIDDIAVRMHCPVISRQRIRNEIVIYGGAIHFSKDSIQNYDSKPFYGRIIITVNGEKKLLNANCYLSELSQEHGIIKVTSNEFNHILIGDIVEIIPIHSCLTAQAMGKYITTKDEEIPMMYYV